MRVGETALEMCIRHVAEQEGRIVRQEALIERLQKIGSPLSNDALWLLADMHALLNTMREHEARLRTRGAT
jgi:hypothetical protein